MNIKKLLLIVVLILFYSCGNNGDEHIGVWYVDNGYDESVTISKGGKNGYVLNYHYYVSHKGRRLFETSKGKLCEFKNDCFVIVDEKKSWFCMSGNKLINVDDGLTFKKQGK
ncbi:MAG: hypothetical protein R2797_09870 [Gelidibacter sp.]